MSDLTCLYSPKILWAVNAFPFLTVHCVAEDSILSIQFPNFFGFCQNAELLSSERANYAALLLYESPRQAIATTDMGYTLSPRLRECHILAAECEFTPRMKKGCRFGQTAGRHLAADSNFN